MRDTDDGLPAARETADEGGRGEVRGGSTPASRLAGVRPPSRPATILACLSVVGALALGRDLLVPFALAGLFSFLLTPLADGIERSRIGRGWSAVVSVLALLGVLAGLGYVAASEAVDLARHLPEYRRNVEEKLESVRAGALGVLPVETVDGGPGPSAAEPSVPSAPSVVDAPGGATAAAETRPLRVRVVPEPPSLIRSFSAIVQPMLAPLGALAVVVVLTTFLLIYRADVRDLLIRLLSRGQIGLTTQAFDEASRRVGRYLASAVLVNAIYGMVIGFGLGLIGLPNAALWGVLAGLLRFVPYVGSWIGGALPFAVAFAAFNGWGRALGVLGLVLVADIGIGNALEPVVYGKRTGLSPLAIVVAITFWTWLWGIPGLFLAVPMTLCVAVAGRYVPGLEFLDILLRDRPALGPADRAYQRLVALDPDGARRVTEEHVAGAAAGDAVAVEEAEDAVLLAALRRAEADHLRGSLGEERLRSVCVGAVEAAEGLEDSDAGARREGEGAPRPAGGAADRSVLCVPAGNGTDRAACEILARRLAARGVPAEVGAAGATSGEVAERVARQGPFAVCVAAVPPFATTRVRYLVKRVRARVPEARVVAAVWDPTADRARLEPAFREAGADRAAFTLADAVAAVRALEVERDVAPPARRRAGSAERAAS